MLTASETKTARKPIEPLEAQSYPARCIQVIDIGVQYNVMADKYQRQVILVWEIPSETITIDGEEKPRIVSETYTLSLNEKAKLYSALVSWRGKQFTDEELKGFDLNSVLDKTCLLDLCVKESKNGNKYNRVKGVSKGYKGMTVPEATTPIFSFDLDADDALEQMKSLPEWIQERIKGGETYKELVEQQETIEELTDINSDELPF